MMKRKTKRARKRKDEAKREEKESGAKRKSVRVHD